MAQILGVILGCYKSTPLQESRPEIPRVEKSKGDDKSLPHLQEASLHDKANSESECSQPLELTTWKTSRNGGNGRK